MSPRIKRQTQPWPEPSESVRPFGVSRHSLATCPVPSGSVHRALLLALLLAAGRLSAFQGTELPRPDQAQRSAAGGLGHVSGIIKRSESLRRPLVAALTVYRADAQTRRYARPVPPSVASRTLSFRSGTPPPSTLAPRPTGGPVGERRGQPRPWKATVSLVLERCALGTAKQSAVLSSL